VTGTNTGKSWNSPLSSLHSAITSAQPGDEIWVKQGVLTPHATDATISFTLKSNISLYGGFQGSELTRAERNWTAYPCTLSGQLTSGNTDNIMTVPATVEYVVIDGFVFKGAVTSLASPWGGALLCKGDNVTISNCTFSSNTAFNGGGAAYISGSGVTFSSCTFDSNNVTASSGTLPVTCGGALLFDNAASGKIEKSVFAANRSNFCGGAVSFFNTTGGTIDACAFYKNNSASWAGAVYSAGNLTVTNSVFSANYAHSAGGAIHCGAASVSKIVNCTFNDSVGPAEANLGVAYGLSVDLRGVDTVAYCIVKQRGTFPAGRDDALIYMTNAQGYFTHTAYEKYAGVAGLGSNNVSLNAADAGFVSPDSPAGDDGLWFTIDDGLMLDATSPCRDTLTSVDAAVAPPASDILGTARPQNAKYDLGAYER